MQGALIKKELPRKQHNSVNQFSFNNKINLKRGRTAKYLRGS